MAVQPRYRRELDFGEGKPKTACSLRFDVASELVLVFGSKFRGLGAHEWLDAVLSNLPYVA